MRFSEGTRVGGYEILGLAGAGGMGEVYRARDPKLDRVVALKVLPSSLAGDANALSRLEREAKAVAALSHPNILAIFDFGNHDGTAYAVMEFLDGQTLRARLADGPLPHRKAVEYARQVALGLSATHEREIVHRDLKPENLFVTTDGVVKILDFGLAKQRLLPSADSNSPTLAPATEPGTVLGTVTYMSPEQVKGLPADHRSDIFSFGAVMHEMLTGKPAFARETAAETMTAILREEPGEILETQDVPPSVAGIVRHCLEKVPAERFQSARDLAFALESLSSVPGSAVSRAGAPQPQRRAAVNRRIALAASCVGVILFLGGWILGRSSGRPGPVRFHRITFRHGNVLSARFTPDGQNVVYAAAWDGRPSQLFTARADGSLSRAIGVESADLLAVSPKGEIAVLVKISGVKGTGTLAVLPAEGGTPREVAEDVAEAAYDQDGMLAAIRRSGDVSRIEYPLGRSIYETPNHLWSLSVSRRGEGLAFAERSDRFLVRVMRDGKVRDVGRDWTASSAFGASRIDGLRWAPEPGHLLLLGAHANAEMAVLDVSIASGRERVILPPSAGAIVLHDVAAGGPLLIERRQVEEQAVYLADGAPEKNISFLDGTNAKDLSADGRTLLFSERRQGGGRSASVYLRNLGDGSSPVRLGDGLACAFSPDGRWVLARMGGSPPHLRLVPTGAGEPVALETSGIANVGLDGAFLRGGGSVLIAGQEASKGWCLYEIRAGAKPRVVATEVDPTAGVVSPDGRTIVATDARRRLVRIPFDGGAPVPLPGLPAPLYPIQWSADGKTLLATSGEGVPLVILRYELATGTVSRWKELMPADPSGVTFISGCAVTRDLKTMAYSYFRAIVSDLYLAEAPR